jgi:amino acid transporter
MVGTGIFATPSTIFSLSGSVGLSLFIWVAGMVIAACGMAVYLEFGLAIPKNGGEKNYLEYVYRRPKFLATGFYTGYVVLLGWAGSNSVIFGEYILHAAQVDVNRWNQRGIGLACITTAFLIHGCALKWGLRLQNLIGVIKLIIVLLIVVSGWVSSMPAIKIFNLPWTVKADLVRLGCSRWCLESSQSSQLRQRIRWNHGKRVSPATFV